MKKRWVLKAIPDEKSVNTLANELGVQKEIASLLVQRGISSFDEAKEFFRPNLENLHNPFEIHDMAKAVKRLSQAVENDERILVYGDYDVDGTTAVALMFSFLNSLGASVDFYIPDRYTEGYGISKKGIDFAHDNDIHLIIALDCGIKSIDKVNYANQLGIDFIICDHHRPGDSLPDAIAVLDPKKSECTYPFKELTGCGIGFKLAQAYCKQHEISFDTLHPYLDLVAVSIAADIVPIVGENRILAHFGLMVLNSTPRAGFKAMLDLAGAKKKQEFTISDIVFTIAPRINAAGRLESGRKAVELLISSTPSDANLSSLNLHNTNNERKFIDKSITEEALSIIGQSPELVKNKSTVVFNKDWHKGVVGIVASRLTETYYRPTIVLTESNGLATGSARSVKNFDVYNAIEACSDLLEQFGGHKYAAGLSLKLENLPAFQTRFEEVVRASINDEDLVPEIEIDAEIDFDKIDKKFYRIVKQFAPFGPENMAPVFLTKNVIDTRSAKMVGNNHLKFQAKQSENQNSFAAIGFGLGDKLLEMSQGKRFDLCFAIDENEWNGITNLQLLVKDIQFKNT